jgi:hypothetical protein
MLYPYNVLCFRVVIGVCAIVFRQCLHWYPVSTRSTQEIDGRTENKHYTVSTSTVRQLVSPDRNSTAEPF